MASTVVGNIPSNNTVTFSTPSVAEDVSSYFLLSDRDNIAVLTDEDGANPDYSETSVTFTIEYKSEDVTSTWALSVYSSTNVTVVNTGGTTYAITNLTDDTGNYILQAIKAGENTRYHTISVYKSKQGVTGATGATGDKGDTGDTGAAGAAVVDGSSVDDLTIGLNGSSKLYVKDGSIGSTQLAVNSVTNVSLQDETIKGNKLDPDTLAEDFSTLAATYGGDKILTLRSIKKGIGDNSINSRGAVALTDDSIALGQAAVAGGHTLINTHSAEVTGQGQVRVTGNVTTSYSTNDIIFIYDVLDVNTGFYLTSTISSVSYSSPYTSINFSPTFGYDLYQELFTNEDIRLYNITKSSSASTWDINSNQIAIGYDVGSYGQNSIAIGSGNSGGTNSILLGVSKASYVYADNAIGIGNCFIEDGADYSVATNYSKIESTAPLSFASGRSLATLIGERVHSSSTYGGTNGYSQFSEVSLWGQTTTNSATEIYIGGYTTDTFGNRKVVLPSNSIYKFIADAVAIRTSNGDVFSARYHGVIKNIGGTTSIVGTTLKEYEYSDGTMTGAYVVIAANDTGDYLSFVVSSNLSSVTVNWTIKVQLTKIAY